MSSPLAFRIDDDLRRRLEQLAEATDRPLSYLAAEALREYIDANEWQVQAIQQGLKAADEGRLIDHEDLVDQWEKKRAAAVD